MNFDIFNLTNIAEQSGLNSRSLRAAVKAYEEKGQVSSTLTQAIRFIAEKLREDFYMLDSDSMNTKQMLKIMADLSPAIGGNDKVISMAVFELSQSSELARCPECHGAAAYLPAIPTIELKCPHCNHVFISR
jgi:hypothetical protein